VHKVGYPTTEHLRCREISTARQSSFFWLQNKEGKPLVGVFATNHQPQVLPPYFVARQKVPCCEIELKKTMASLAKVVLIDRNFYNFFGM
jgi:hypothetical protein